MLRGRWAKKLFALHDVFSENYFAHDAMTRKTQRLAALVEIGQLLNSTLNLDQILQIILGTATEHLGADRGTVYLIDHDKSELWSKVFQGDEIVEIRLKIGQGLAGFVANTGRKVILKDA